MRALVVRFSAIGDCVMAVPVAAAIREAAPDAHILWAVEPRCAAVVDTGRLVNRLALFPRDEWEGSRWSPATWRDQVRRYTALRKERFDIGVDLQGHSKTALCLRLARPSRRIAVRSTDALAKRLNPQLGIPIGKSHMVERNMLALSKLGEFASEPRWVMPALEVERRAVACRLPEGRPLATIAVASGSSEKNYPLDRWREVGRRLLASGWSVAFLGGPGDPSAALDGAADLVGKLKLEESMAAVALSDVHLAADTGTGHIAAAYGVPVVSIFGRTKVTAYRPYTPLGRVIEPHGGPANAKPEEIVAAAGDLLEVRRAAVSH